jgi:hypothetical protein
LFDNIKNTRITDITVANTEKLYIEFEMACNKTQMNIKLAYEIKRQGHVEPSIILSAADVVPKKVHKSLKLLNLIKALSNNTQRAATLGSSRIASVFRKSCR